jgi:hypothetical protein
VLFPRVADHTTLNPDASSDFGLTVFNTTSKSYWYWDGNEWQELQTSFGGNLDYIQNQFGSTQTVANFRISGDGALSNLYTSQNIGIGTEAPSEKLELEFSGRGGILLDGDDTQDAFIQIENGGGSHYIFDDDSDGHALKFESAAGREIVFNTDGANERMTIQSDGRVRVNNLSEPTGAVVTSNSAGVLAKTALTGNANDVLLGTGAFGSASAFEDDDWYQALSTNTPTGIGDWIYTNGHVGIGTGSGTNPSAPLHVVASGSGNPASNSILAVNPNNSVGNDAIVTARVAGSSAGDPFFSMDISGEAGWSIGIDNSDDNRLKIAPSWSNLSAGTALTIKTDGNVGVGTTGPTEKLTVTGTNSDTYSALGLRSGNNTLDFNNGAQIAFGYNGTDDYQHFIHTRHNSGNSNNAIDFYVSNGTQNNTVTSGSVHTMSLVSGNVGVGTTAPAQKLEVAGNTRITGLSGGGDRIVYTNNNGDLYASTGIPANDADYIWNQNSSAQGANWRITGQGEANTLVANANGNWYLRGGDDHELRDVNVANTLGIWGRQNSDRAGIQLGSDGSYIFGDNGNIGIGYTTPAQKLHIDGDVKIGVNTSTLRSLYFGDASYVYLQETADDYFTIEAANGTRIGNQGTYTRDVFHGTFTVGNNNGDQCSVCAWRGWSGNELEIQVPWSALGIPDGTNKTVMLMVDGNNNTYNDTWNVALQTMFSNRMDILIDRTNGGGWGLTTMRIHYIIMNNN